MRRSAQFDWPGWRADLVERLGWRWIGAGSAYAAVFTAVRVLAYDDMLPAFVFYTLFHFSTVMVILAVLAVALVGVTRGIPAWVAYPAAGLAVAAIGTVLSLFIEVHSGSPPRPLHVMIVTNLFAVSALSPPAVLYVYASSTAHDQKVLRALEAERAAEADRLAQQRLQTERATVDHDLVLNALRLALTARADEDSHVQALLEAVTAYLRLAQQRSSSEPDRIAAALAELRRACASTGATSAPQVMA